MKHLFYGEFIENNNIEAFAVSMCQVFRKRNQFDSGRGFRPMYLYINARFEVWSRVKR